MAKITAFRRRLAVPGKCSQIAVVLSTQLVYFAAPGFAAEDWLSEAAGSDISADGKGGREFRYLEPSEGFEAELEIEYENRSVVIEPADIEEETEAPGGLSQARQAVTTSSVMLLGGYNFSRHTQAQLGVRFSDIRSHGYLEPSAGHGSEWEVDQFWMQTRAPGHANAWLRLGRYEISDQSAWWWDERIDGVTWQGCPDEISCTIGLWTLPRSMVHTQDEPDPDTEDLWWLGGSADWQVSQENTLTSHALLRMDQSPGYQLGQAIPEELFDSTDSSLAWLGLHSTTHWLLPRFGAVSLQVNGAFMSGSHIQYSAHDATEIDATDDLEASDATEEPDASDDPLLVERQKYSATGWAIDTRLHWQPLALSTWQVTLGYAVASGTRSSGKPGSGTFVQSGLHSNDPDFPRYGYLYNPDLSNIQILTLGMNIPVGLPGYVHLQHNRYRRYSATDTLLETDVDIDPDELHLSLGHETGLGYLLELESGLSVELLAARFTAGRAYGGFHGRHLDQWKMQLTYEF